MRKVVQCMPLHHRYWKILQMVHFEESMCSDTERICWHMMTTGSSATFEGNPPGTVRRAVLERNIARSHVLLVPTGDDHSGVPSNRGIPEGAGQPIGIVPVDPKPDPCQPCGTELSASQQVYQIPTMQLNRPTLKHNF